MIYDFVFVVLCYRNTKDLVSFLDSIKTITGTYKVIVVNSFYDDESKNKFEEIASMNDCNFLNVENKGYGAGNNRGIEYAKEHFKFRYLVISNPDIEFRNFSVETISGMEDYIIGPEIITLNKKQQNPYKPYKRWIIDGLEYFALKHPKFHVLYYLGAIINRGNREYILFTNKLFNVKRRRVYTVHGSCVIIGSSALEKLGTIYDEKMFLFCEEHEMGNVAKKVGVKSYIVPSIKVLHKEDGSTSLINKKNINNYEKESYIYCYEKWHKKSRRK